jgi:hypothetical protein
MRATMAVLPEESPHGPGGRRQQQKQNRRGRNHAARAPSSALCCALHGAFPAEFYKLLEFPELPALLLFPELCPSS